MSYDYNVSERGALCNRETSEPEKHGCNAVFFGKYNCVLSLAAIAPLTGNRVSVINCFDRRSLLRRFMAD